MFPFSSVNLSILCSLPCEIISPLRNNLRLLLALWCSYHHVPALMACEPRCMPIALKLSPSVCGCVACCHHLTAQGVQPLGSAGQAATHGCHPGGRDGTCATPSKETLVYLKWLAKGKTQLGPWAELPGSAVMHQASWVTQSSDGLGWRGP